jgi:hypothetical protein
VVAGVLLISGVAAAAETRLEFNRDVRPILSDRCFYCHGTDANQRKGDLRLDEREAALEALAPGREHDSEVLRRIFSDDADEVMPPPETNLTLSAEEKQTLRQWIAQGAEYQGHWAFQPVAAPVVPPVTVDGGNEIDALVAATLQEERLTLRPVAAPARLLRRLSFDLTGLPPTPAEAQAFEAAMAAVAADPSRGPAVIAAEVDRLLASPHFGERMATDWLDVARYADTFGYQSDVAMNVWPWRDWVIRAFNDNLPFDQFITWQLAGDLLPNPSRDQQLATTFNRLHRQTNEGGSVNEEFRVEYVTDRVETYGMAFLGLTLNCAKCHDHKYDPVTQRDYFSLFAYFQNIDESGLYSHFTDAVPTPALSLATPEQEQARTLAAAKVARAEAELVLDRDHRRDAYEAWRAVATAPAEEPWPEEIGRFSFDALTDGTVANALNEAEPGRVFDDVTLVPGARGQAVKLSGENNVSFALGGKWTRDDAFSLALWIKPPSVIDRAVVFHRSKAWTDAASNGYELLIEDGRLSAALVHFWPGNALRVVTRDPLPVNEWTHVVWSYDGSSRAAGLTLFVNGRPAAVEVVRDALTKDINRGGEDRLTIGQRFRDRGFKDGAVDELRLFARAISPYEAAVLAGRPVVPPTHPAAEAAGVLDHFLLAVDATHREKLAALRMLRQARSAAGDSLPEIMTMRETAEPKPAFVLARGAYDAPTTPVSARPPEFLAAVEPGAPTNRLGLARWTVSPQNPLTSRVLVNRLWQSFFGEGLVRTPEDFGFQGALPTHPELLDFLARRFMESGWDFKALVRFIVSSRTYQQDSDPPPDVRAQDPENRLLARGPAFRLSAEQLRDQALLAAGQLNPALGGPSVDPDQAGRRSLYTFWKRTMPDVRMDLFDMAKREVCSARRPLTHTPLQALTLLNEPSFVAWSRRVAEAAATEHPDDESAAITTIFRRLTSQAPTDRQHAILRQIRAEQSALSGQDGAAASLAGLQAVAQAVMNFDASVMKR